MWGSERSVIDRVLDTAIRDIRKAFGDRARRPTYIQTIPKQGYRLIADLEWPPARSSILPHAVLPAAEGLMGNAVEGFASKPAKVVAVVASDKGGGHIRSPPQAEEVIAPTSPLADPKKPVSPAVLADAKQGAARSSFARSLMMMLVGMVVALVILTGARWWPSLGSPIRVEVDRRSLVGDFERLEEALVHALQDDDCGDLPAAARPLELVGNLSGDQTYIRWQADVVIPNQTASHSLRVPNATSEADLARYWVMNARSSLDRTLCLGRAEAELDPGARCRCLRAARLAQRENRWQEAYDLAAEVVAAEPGDRAALKLMARSSYAEGEVERAWAWLEEILEARSSGGDPEASHQVVLEVQQLRAQLAGAIDEEVESLHQLRELQSGDWRWPLRLGHIALEVKRSCSSALALFGDAQRLGGGIEAEVATARAKFSCDQQAEGLEALKLLADRHPDSTWLQNHLATALLDSGQAAHTREVLQEMSSSSAEHVPSLLVSARLNRELGVHGEARREAMAALVSAYGPREKSRAAAAVAWVHLSHGDLEMAAERVWKAIESDSNNDLARWLVGRVAILHGDFQEAERQSQHIDADVRALARVHSLPLSHHLNAKIAAARGDWQNALLDFEHAVLWSPPLWQGGLLRFDLATAYSQAGKSDAAIETLEDLFALNPQHLLGRCLHGQLLEQRGDKPAARDSYALAFEGRSDPPLNARVEACRGRWVVLEAQRKH